MRHSMAQHPWKLFVSVVCLMAMAFTTGLAQELPVTTNSEDARQLYWKGLSLLENVNFNKALPFFTQAVKADPDFALAHLQKSFTETDPAKSNADMEKALSLKGKASEGERLMIDALTSFQKQDAAATISALDKLTSMFPKDKHVQFAAAMVYQNLNEPQKGAEYSNRAIAIDKDFAPAYNILGYSNLDLGNTAEAETALKTYASMVPDDPNPHDSYAELLLNMGRYDESIEHYTKAITLDPTFHTSAFGIGHNYVFKGDFEKARQFFQKGIDASQGVQGRIDGLMWIASTYLHQGKTDEAIKTLEKRQALAEQNNRPAAAGSYGLIGMILVENGKPAEAVKYSEKADGVMKKLKLSEDERATLVTDAQIRRAYALAANGQVDQARSELAKARPAIERSGSKQQLMALHSVSGVIEKAAGDQEKALEEFGQADPDDALSAYHWAMTLEKKGDAGKANELYTRIAKSNKDSFGLALVRTKAIEKSGGVQAGRSQVK